MAGAESEVAGGQYNNCADRCYYACFQAAIVALIGAGVRPAGGRDEWGHAFVQGEFVGRLINRRKRYPAALRETLAETWIARERGDDRASYVSQRQATHSLAGAREFVAAVIRGEDSGER